MKGGDNVESRQDKKARLLFKLADFKAENEATKGYKKLDRVAVSTYEKELRAKYRNPNIIVR